MIRRVCVVTGTRAEYGLLQRLLREIADDRRFALQLVATGSHLSPEFGLTYRAIEADGFAIDRKIEMLMSSDSAVGTAKAVGLGVIGFADAFADLNPDIVVVLGDRFEVFAAVQAAFFAGIAVAHISGGEVTRGALDDGLRHSITKMARFHFVAAERYRERVIQLGEQPDSVFNVGDPGLDNVARLALLDRAALGEALEFDLDRRFLLATYHPETAGGADSAAGLKALLEALDGFPACKVLFTEPNADAGGRALARIVGDYAGRHRDRVKVFTSLGQLRYLSAMHHCAAVVGNSSSGIVEAPAMGRPSVNIGTRQDGRLKAASIVDCDANVTSITAALSTALSEDFTRSAARATSLYGSCNAATRMREILASVDVARHRAKRFHDLRN